jgi:hypothetical protein
MSAVHREITRSKGHSADLTHVAKHFGTSIIWVERCMQAYGKRVDRPGTESSDGREQRLSNFEDEEATEKFPEDVEEPGGRERGPRLEVEKPPRPTPRPTPDESGEVEKE